jgi:hypothetical protein
VNKHSAKTHTPPENPLGPGQQPEESVIVMRNEFDGERRKIILTRNGPALIEGPVELVAGDGTTIRSDRFLVASCMCRRSKNFPLCDASHRRHRRGKSN